MSGCRHDPRGVVAIVTKEIVTVIPLRRIAVPLAFLAAAVLLVLVGSAVAIASVPAPAWQITPIAEPTNFAEKDTEFCGIPEFSAQYSCDHYDVLITNVGDQASTGTVTLTIKLPSGVSTIETPGVGNDNSDSWSCTPGGGLRNVTCVFSAPVGPLVSAQRLIVPVKVNELLVKEGATVTSEFTVAGGLTASAPTASATARTTISSAVPSVGPDLFDFGVFTLAGAPDLGAGAHPGALTTIFHLADTLEESRAAGPYFPVGFAKNVVVDLPRGLVGDPLATGAERCPETLLGSGTSGVQSDCPPDTQVGFAYPDTNGLFSFVEEYPIYNITPPGGYPAEFGFVFLSKKVTLYASVGPPPAYTLQVAATGIATAAELQGVSVVFYGDPAEHDGGHSTARPFLTDPTRCSPEPLAATLRTDTWEDPTRWVSSESVVYPEITGCDLLKFEPAIEAQPTSGVAGSSVGLDFNLKLPQNEEPKGLATPALRDATVTLPEGLSINPSDASGLSGCRAEGPEGINVGSGRLGPEDQDLGDPEATELGAGYLGGDGSPYDDGLYHTAPGHCPGSSQIGEVEIFTPLLSEPLHGRVYIGVPECAPCTGRDAEEGRLVKLYIEAAGSGVIVKLPGDVSVNPATGRLTATFKENPELPFDELKLRFKEGQRAPLTTPATCGSYEVTTNFEPWSAPETPDATPSRGFAISAAPGGGACPVTAAQEPNKPSFDAGAATSTAGAYSPFVLTLTREDDSQELKALNVTLPPGLVGRIAGVGECPEAQIAAAEASGGAAENASPSCPSSSEVGTVTVGAGSGAPFYATGHAYLAGPYKGAPFSLVIVTPALAGPFDLGTVVVRSGLYINPETAQVTVKSDPIPTILDGIPLDIHSIAVNIDRPQFTLNPTNCTPMSITGTAFGAISEAALSDPFQVGGCTNLPFKPSFTASTQAKTSKADGASLIVSVAQKPGEANIHKVELQLPLILPARLTTLQKACTEAQFEMNPAGCPEASDIGTASAVTPLLSVPLTGPAYLVSHGGAAFPDVEFILQGDGVQVDLDGKTDIKAGITYSKFETVPDAPISSFVTTLPEGPHSALAANGNLCANARTVSIRKRVTVHTHGHTKHITKTVKETTAPQPPSMPTTIIAQNGAQITQNTKISVTGCPKAKATKKKKKKTKAKAKPKKKHGGRS